MIKKYSLIMIFFHSIVYSCEYNHKKQLFNVIDDWQKANVFAGKVVVFYQYPYSLRAYILKKDEFGAPLYAGYVSEQPSRWVNPMTDIVAQGFVLNRLIEKKNIFNKAMPNVGHYIDLTDHTLATTRLEMRTANQKEIALIKQALYARRAQFATNPHSFEELEVVLEKQS